MLFFIFATHQPVAHVRGLPEGTQAVSNSPFLQSKFSTIFQQSAVEMPKVILRKGYCLPGVTYVSWCAMHLGAQAGTQRCLKWLLPKLPHKDKYIIQLPSSLEDGKSFAIFILSGPYGMYVGSNVLQSVARYFKGVENDVSAYMTVIDGKLQYVLTLKTSSENMRAYGHGQFHRALIALQKQYPSTEVLQVSVTQDGLKELQDLFEKK